MPTSSWSALRHWPVTAPTISLAANADGTGTPTTNSDVVYVKATGGDLADYDGDLTLGLVNDSSIQDLAGNVSFDEADDAASTEAYTIDNTAPEGTTMSFHYDSDFVPDSEVVRAGDELELQYQGYAHGDVDCGFRRRPGHGRACDRSHDHRQLDR